MIPAERGADHGRAAQEVGPRLRTARSSAGLSVRALAREAGVSPSLVSQIERGKVNPSITSLYTIASALGVSLDALLAPDRAGDAPTPAASAQPRPDRVLRSHARPSLMLASGVRWERLAAAPGRDVEFLLLTFAVGAASCPAEAPMTHSGREYGLVMTGRLGATIGGEHYDLGPGDSIAFDSSVPHRFWTIGDRPALVTWTMVRTATSRAGEAASPFEA